MGCVKEGSGNRHLSLSTGEPGGGFIYWGTWDKGGGGL